MGKASQIVSPSMSVNVACRAQKSRHSWQLTVGSNAGRVGLVVGEAVGEVVGDPVGGVVGLVVGAVVGEVVGGVVGLVVGEVVGL